MAKTRICDVCGKELAKESKWCPNCGAKIKMPKWLKWFLIGEAIFLVLVLILLFL